MKFKIFFIFTLIFSSLPLCAMDHSSDLDVELVKAIRTGNIEQVETSLSDGANPNIRTTDGVFFSRPLIFAIEKSSTKIVKLLLDFHANVDARTNIGQTALMFAASHGHTEIVKILLDYHANVNAQCSLRQTALMCAASDGHTEIVKILLDHHANINAQDDNQTTPLMYAARNGHTNIVKLLLDHHADFNAQDKYGWTALMDVAEKGHTTIVNILLNHGAHIYKPNNTGMTPLKFAAKWNHVKIVELLLKHINHILDQIDDPKIYHYWDQYILDALNGKPTWYYLIKMINAFRMLLYHADKLPLSRKKLESLTSKVLGHRYDGERAFRKTIKHLRKNAF